MKDYSFYLQNIQQPDTGIFQMAMSRLDALAKPPGSLGKLEDTAARLCAINGNLTPSIKKRCIIVLAADNGVVSEGVSAAPQAVTATQTINIINGITGVGVLAKLFNTDIFVADVGVNADITHDKLIDRKIRKGTGNIAKEAAMTKSEVITAVQTGVELAHMAYEQGYQAIGVGEMGIGNTTSSSAVLAALLGVSDSGVPALIGRGAGLDDAAFMRKIEVVKTALDLHKPDKNDPLSILQTVGGLDLAAMTGVYIGAAYYRLPVVIDGFISVVAALCAVRLNQGIREYMFASHASFERGYAAAVEALGVTPCLNLEMRLGEGSGCPLMFGVMDGALAIFTDMATLDEASVSQDYIDQIGKISF